MVTYAVPEVFQHSLSRALCHVQLSITDQRDICPDLLELTAGHTHQGSVESLETNENAGDHDESSVLSETKIEIRLATGRYKHTVE